MKREFRRGAALNTKNSHGISRAMAAILFKAIHAQSLCGITLNQTSYSFQNCRSVHCIDISVAVEVAHS